MFFKKNRKDLDISNKIKYYRGINETLRKHKNINTFTFEPEYDKLKKIYHPMYLNLFKFYCSVLIAFFPEKEYSLVLDHVDMGTNPSSDYRTQLTYFFERKNMLYNFRKALSLLVNNEDNLLDFIISYELFSHEIYFRIFRNNGDESIDDLNKYMEDIPKKLSEDYYIKSVDNYYCIISASFNPLFVNIISRKCTFEGFEEKMLDLGLKYGLSFTKIY